MKSKRTLGLVSIGLLTAALSIVTIKITANIAQPMPDNLYGQITPFTLPPVTMQNHLNQNADWSDFDETPTFLTTGFTSCHDVCPMTMAFYQRLKSKLGTQAKLVFLTVDPQTDTTEQLNQYLSGFDKDFVGLRIEPQKELTLVLDSLKQTYALSTDTQNIGHQSYIYLLHPKLDGLMVYTASHPDVNLIKQDLDKLSL